MERIGTTCSRIGVSFSRSKRKIRGAWDGVMRLIDFGPSGDLLRGSHL